MLGHSSLSEGGVRKPGALLAPTAIVETVPGVARREAVRWMDRRDGHGDPALRLGITCAAYYVDEAGLRLVERARLAESLGFDDLWCPDHTVFRRPLGDVQVMASMAAAATNRIQICTGVIQAGMRHPVALAKWVGALSHEIPGRLLVGLGVGGDYRAEWDAVGVDVSERGGRFDEVLDVLPALLRNEPVRHRGKHYAFDVDSLFAAPPPSVPIWVGARVATAMRRVARADGWLGMIRFPDEFATQRNELLAATATRVGAPLQTGLTVVASVLGSDAEATARCSDFFRTMFGVPPGRGDRRAVGGIAALRDLIAQYRAAGADRIGLMIIDPPEQAWPLVAKHLIS